MEAPPFSSLKKPQRKVLQDVTNGTTTPSPRKHPHLLLLSTKLAASAQSSPPAVADGGAGAEEEDHALRSQVKCLLHKVEADIHKAPSLRTLCHINGFLSSPSRLAAPPTPSSNTPGNARGGAAVAAAGGGGGGGGAGASPAPRRIPIMNLQEFSIPIYADLPTPFSPRAPPTPPPIPSAHANTPPTPRISAAIRQPPPAPSSSTEDDIEAMDCSAVAQETLVHAEGAEADQEPALLHPITRTLQFASPEKSVTEISLSSISCSASTDSSPSRPESELDDGETSNWSVLVNVSSPGRMRDESDLPPDYVVIGEDVEAGSKPFDASSSSVGSYLQKNPQESNKLELLWAERMRSPPFIGDENEYEDCDSEFYDSGVEEDYQEYEEETTNEDGTEYYDLCSGLSSMMVHDKSTAGLPEFKGKHTRFVYNSDDEIEDTVVISERSDEGLERSPSVMHLRGLPTPVGKHLRFSDECEAPTASSEQRNKHVLEA